MKSRLLTWVLFLVAILVLWEGVLRTGLVSPAALAYPSEVAKSIPRIFSVARDADPVYQRGNIWDTWSTLWRSLLAFLISVPCGVLLGFAIFFGGRANAPATFLLDFLRSIPATALVPVFLIIIGENDTTKIAVGVFSSSLVICLATLAGLNGRNETRVGIANILGIKGLRRLLLLDLPEAAPQIFLGLRAGISLALILVIVSEMFIGSNEGLGKVINDMRNTDDKGRMYAAILVIGVIGYLYNLGLSFAERKLVHWRGTQ
jgi:NitT/TauT family transport system permease protein